MALCYTKIQHGLEIWLWIVRSFNWYVNICTEKVPTQISTCGAVAQVLIWPFGECVASLLASKTFWIHPKIRLLSTIHMYDLYKIFKKHRQNRSHLFFKLYSRPLEPLQNLRNQFRFISSKTIVMLMCTYAKGCLFHTSSYYSKEIVRKFWHSFKACGSLKLTVNAFDRKTDGEGRLIVGIGI